MRAALGDDRLERIRLHPAPAGVHDLAEACVPMPGGVSIAERADRCRSVALLAEDGRESAQADTIVVRARGSFAAKGSSRPGVVYDAVSPADLTGPQGGTRRQARRVGDPAVGESNSFARDAVDVRTRVAVIPVTTQMVRPQAVDVDVKNVRGHRPARGVRPVVREPTASPVDREGSNRRCGRTLTRLTAPLYGIGLLLSRIRSIWFYRGIPWQAHGRMFRPPWRVDSGPVTIRPSRSQDLL